MKYRYILISLAVAFPISVILRTLHILYTVDGENGFVIQRYSFISMLLLGVIGLVIGLCTVLGATVRRKPVSFPKPNIALSFASIIFACGIFYECFITKYPVRIPVWQEISVKIFGFAAGIVLLAYGIVSLLKKNFKPLLFAVPVLYSAARLLIIFTEINSVPLIMDNIFSILTQCASLLFLLQIAKEANDIRTEKSYKLLMSSGILTVLLCSVSSIPSIIINLAFKNYSLHAGVTYSFVTFVCGVFALAFLLSFFSEKNLKKKHGHKHRHTSEPSTADMPVTNHTGVAYFSFPSDKKAVDEASESKEKRSEPKAEKPAKSKKLKSELEKEVKETETEMPDENPDIIESVFIDDDDDDDDIVNDYASNYDKEVIDLDEDSESPNLNFSRINFEKIGNDKKDKE